MKKILITSIVLICVLLALSACGKAPQPSPASDPTPAPVSEPTPAPAAPEESAAPEENDPLPSVEPEPTPEAPAFDEAKFNAALALKGEDISLLYEAIGEPFDSSYAPSCIGGTGEDGELYYEGFYVASYRNEGKEIVWDVISDVDY